MQSIHKYNINNIFIKNSVNILHKKCNISTFLVVEEWGGGDNTPCLSKMKIKPRKVIRHSKYIRLSLSKYSYRSGFFFCFHFVTFFFLPSTVVL